VRQRKRCGKAVPPLFPMTMMKRRTILYLAITLLPLIPFEPAAADIYQYTDKDGVVHFSNVNVERGKKFRKVRTEPKKEQAGGRARGSAGPTVRASSPEAGKVPQTYIDIINSACDRHGVDPALVRAIVKVESDFNTFAMSRKGAMGLMQLMPQTAFDMKVRDTFNPGENIDGGVKYLRYLIDRYEGNLSLALAAYNSGETAVNKWGAIPPFPETKSYVQRVLKLYNGTGSTLTPANTIYVGYGDDGSLMLTDDPAKHKNMKRKTRNDL
jgi:soluble lytic murein transglycosylase-like protein